MEFEDEELLEPVSPTGQYIGSSVLTLAILGVIELETPIRDSVTNQLFEDLLLPLNPRFSSLMITGEHGEMKWKRTEVNMNEHVKFAKFPQGLSPNDYDVRLSNYLSELVMEQFPSHRPLWDIHIFNYPTTDAVAHVIFRLHHALGDGYSIMGALLSCLKRLDNPSLPITFPSRQSTTRFNNGSTNSIASGLKLLPRLFTRFFDSIYYFGYSVLKCSLLEDDRSPIRSAAEGVEFRPMTVTTLTFSLDQMKQIKAKLQVTVNDVIVGMIMYGTRLYMQQVNHRSRTARSTVLALLNTRPSEGYKSISEMVKPNAEMPWGNRICFMPVPIPKLTATMSSAPLSFILHAKRIIQRQRYSASAYLTDKLLATVRKVKGPKAASRCMHNLLKNSCMIITNMIGPLEKTSLADHPVKGIYFAVPGLPQSLHVTVVSYVGNVRISIVTEKDYIDPYQLKSCINNAFEAFLTEAVQPSPPSAE